MTHEEQHETESGVERNNISTHIVFISKFKALESSSNILTRLT